MTAPADDFSRELRLLRTDDGEALAVEPQPFAVRRILEGDAPPPPRLHVEDLLVEGDVNVWTAHGGHGKSTSMLDAAISVALGGPVFGTLAVRRPGPVLIVAPEDGEGVVRMVLDALIVGRGLGDEARAVLAERLVMVEDREAINLLTDTRRLGVTVRDVGAVLAILDPLANMLGAESERDESIAARVCDALRRHVCRDGGATSLVSHHFRKPGRLDADQEATAHDTRGSGGWVNGARAVFGVSKKGERVSLSLLKGNRLRSEIRHELVLSIAADNAGLWTRATLTNANAGTQSEALTPGVGRNLNENELKALRCLQDTHEPGRRVSHTDWRETADLPKGTFRHVKDRLLDAQLANAMATGQKNPDGTPRYSYGISDRGRTALEKAG